MLVIAEMLVLPPRMSELSCPLCTMNEVLEHPGRYECVVCGHEWDREADSEQEEAVTGGVA